MTVRNVVDLVCQEVVELVTEYLGGSMQAEDRVRLEQHLLACPPCTAHLAQVRATLALARDLGQQPSASASTPARAAEPAGEADQDLLSLFRRWSRK